MARSGISQLACEALLGTSSPLYAALWAEQQRANGWKIKPEASPQP